MSVDSLAIPTFLDRRADARQVPDRAVLALDLIRADQRAQPRENLNTDITQAYADDMAEGIEFPPLTVYFDGETYWLADGFHRRYAAISLGLAEFPCEIRRGGLREAILHSCSANAEHGHRRSNADKRRAVTRLLEDEEWRQWSDREIARQCRVHHTFVGKMRSEMETVTGDNTSEERTYTTKHGTKAKMNTAGLKANGKGNHGAQVNLPKGMTAEELCRKGMALEESGHSGDDVARSFGVAASTYRRMRDIVLLNDRNDLRPEDAEIAARALALLNETSMTREPYEMVFPIVERIWGATRNKRRSQTEAMRLSRFESAIVHVTDTCTMFAREVDVPYLSADQAKEAAGQLKEAEKKLREVRARIEEAS